MKSHRSTRLARRKEVLSHATLETLESRQLMASIASTTPYNGQQAVSVSANLTVTFGSAMTASSLTSANVILTDSAGGVVPSVLTYSGNTLTINPNNNLASTSNYYTLRVVGGPNGVKDSLNGPLSADYSFSFTTGTPVFNETSVFSNLIQPTAIEFSPDGRVFVAEKRGVIKVFDNLTDTSPDVFADLRTQVHNYWDRGLLGLALDPQFTTGRPYVYVLYTRDADLNGNAPKWGTANTDSDPGASDGSGTVSGRLSRLTASGNFMTGSEQVLVTDWQNQYPSHSIGDLKFGPDGYLYASAGDGASFSAVDYGQNNVFGDPTNEGGAVRSQDIATTGDSQTLDGTVIRIDPDTGAAAPGNPYASSGDANARRIVATGLRNPFRLTFRPGTSELWIAETGWNTYEEINRIVNAGDATPDNFGWPAYEGPARQSGYDAANLPVLENLYNQGTGAVVMPWFSYAHSAKVVAGSAEPTGGSTPTGLLFYTGGAYPAAYNDAFFFADYARKQIYVMYRGVDGMPDQSTRQVFRSLASGAVELNQGPDGAIYYVDHLGGRIVRVGAGLGTSIATKLTGAYIGTAPVGTSYTLDKAFDGNLSTFYEASVATGGWVGLDLGSPRWVRQIKFAPRSGQAARMVGGKFQASNDPNFASGVVDLYTVASAPTVGTLTGASVNPNGASYRYVRYLSPANGYADVAEIEFYAGDGLAATYYDNSNFTGTTATRVDPTVNFVWGAGAPISGIGIDTFSARWTGMIQAIESGTYTFKTTSDDGVRLWVNDTLIIDKWVDQSSTSWTNTINLTAGQLYNIKVEYYENGGDASVVLEWQRPGRGMEIVPASSLFSSAPTSNQAPIPTIGSPLASLNWKVGDTINFSGSATDPEDGVLPASALTWSLVLVHGNLIDPNNTHEHPVQSFSGVAGGSFVAPDHEYPSWLELRLTATDSSNRTTTISRRIDPLTSTITLASSPAGATLSFGSSSAVAPFSQTLIVGSAAQVSAPSQMVIGGLTYLFTGWSDGGSITHDITAPATNTTLTANYALPPAPAAPSGLVASTQSSTQINLSWADNASNETSYRIERRIVGGTFAALVTLGANVTTYPDTGLTPGTTYEYRVYAAGAGGNSGFSNVASTTTTSAATAPDAPTNLASSNITTSSVTLTWTDNATNETGYRVERRLAGGTFATIATLAASAITYPDSGLTPGATYEYRVRAFNGAGDSLASNTLGVTMQSSATVPVAPGSLTATVLAGPQVQLNWVDNSANETSFIVQRRYAGWIWGDIATVGANATSYLDTSAIGNVTYEYRIVATNAAGSSDFSNFVLVDTAVTGAVPPATPTNLASSAVSATQVNLTWTDVAVDETGYKIERRIAGGVWAQIATAGVNAASYSDTTVVAGNTYEYRVRATKGAVDGAYSNSSTVTTPGGAGGIPSAPSGLTAAITTRPNVQLNWTDTSNNETAFVVQRRYAGWIWGDVGTVGANITSYLDTSGINNVTYEYRVVAQGAGGSSPFSNSVIVNTA